MRQPASLQPMTQSTIYTYPYIFENGVSSRRYGVGLKGVQDKQRPG